MYNNLLLRKGILIGILIGILFKFYDVLLIWKEGFYMDEKYDLIEKLLAYKDEYEWLDFKENWFNKDEIGEYISAIANGAALFGMEYGYIVWGVTDKTKEIVGISVNFNKDIDHEPYKHYLSRNLNPKIAFDVLDFDYYGKRIVI